MSGYIQREAERLEDEANEVEELREENAKLREQLEDAIRHERETVEIAEKNYQRAEAAEAKLKAASEQEPVADVQEQALLNVLKQTQREKAALERKLAEQQSITQQAIALMEPMKNYIPSEHVNRWLACITSPSQHFDAAIAQAREEGRKEAVPDGWQVVPVNPTSEMTLAGERERLSHVGNINPRTTWLAMLASAPTPEVKP